MSLSLRINLIEGNVTKTIVFDSSTTVYDACRIIREKCTEANMGQPKDYGLFLTDEDNKTGVWLEPARQLEYYLLRNGDLLEYRKKLRTLRVKMLDESVKTMLVDDSQIVANLMVVICTKLGITNHDEYSLVLQELPENQENIDNRNYGTLTLKRKKEEKIERDAKMEQLRKKLHTDDEVPWLDPAKTLREQGIDEHETVILRRKFFFSDQNIDSHDPVQLNLLYVQARDAILNGTHPITESKACEFAGVQCQIQFGDFVENKHKPGFLEPKEFLPQSYVKVKGIEKKIFAEHKKHQGLDELEAKVLYTKNARSLKTYGVTFFLVKEKMKGKNKLVPRLLGVTKDSVLRLDEKTKEIVQTWPLTTVRRWGASPNTFTLDFGDYSDQYYSVQTTEGEQIQQIISGYIDIILKKKQAKDHYGIEGDEGSTMFEENVAARKGTILQHETNKVGGINTVSLAKRTIMRAGSDGEKTFVTGVMSSPQLPTVGGQVNLGHAPSTAQQTKVTSVLTEPQRALVSTITQTQTRIKESEYELETRAQIPELGTDASSMKWKQVTLDTRKQNVGSSIAAMNAATAQVVTLTSGPQDEVDHNAVGAAITTIGTNLPEVTKDVKMIAALMEDRNMGEKLLDATRKLCFAFSDLLKAAEPESKETRQSLLNAATRVGEASTQVLATIGEDTPENKELQDMLLSLAKAVANTTAALVLKAKNIASTCEDQQTQNRVIGAATQCALATSQLVACAKVVAPTLTSTACQEQLTTAVREVTKAVENLVAVCNECSRDEELNMQLKSAASEVTRTLNDLLKHIKLASRDRAKESIQEYSVEEIYTATDKLTAASGDPNEMVRQARRLGQATAQLIQSIKGEAERLPDSDIQRRLLAAAKTLADATAKMVEAARQCANYPQEVAYQDALRRTAEELRDVTIVAATTPALREKLVETVQVCARKAVSSATQCITAAQTSNQYNTNAATRETLITDTHELAEHIPPLVDSIKANASAPQYAFNQSELMYIAEVFVHPAVRFVQSSRAVLPTLSEQAITERLSTTSQQLNSDLSELRDAITRAKPACQGLGFHAASQLIESLQEELAEFEKALQMHSLRPLPGDSSERGAQLMSASSKAVNQGIAQLISAAAQGNESYTAQAARDTAESLRALTSSIRTVAATSNDLDVQKKLINSNKEVLSHYAKLIEESQKSLNTVGVTPGLEHAARGISESLKKTIGCLPGQRDVDNAISNIIEWTSTITMNNLPSTMKSYGELQQELNTAAANLNEASSSVVISVKSPTQLASSSKDFSAAFHDLLNVSLEMAGQTPDIEVKSHMVHSLKNVSTSSSSLLTTAKSLSADFNLPNGKNQLATAARAVTDSINYLVNICTSAAPGQNECDNAIRKIQAARYLLENPSEPVNDCSYYEALDAVIDKSKVLGDAMTGITSSAKKSEHEKFCENIKTFSGAICNLVESSAQSAYLIAISEPTSIAGRPGLVDQAQFARASQAIHQGCAALSSSSSPQKQVLDAATLIAKHTSALCNSCRVASAKTSNPVAKRQFVESAKAVANSTSALVKQIKALDLNYSDENRRNCADATEPLLDAVNNLCIYASSSEFASVPAKISLQARQSQQPILDPANRLIDSSCSVINTAKNLIVMSKDPSTWQQFASTSKQVSDSMKLLVTNIRNNAPGKNECENAAHTLNNHLRNIDSACMDAVSQSLVPRRSATLPVHSQQVERAAAGLYDTIEPLRHAGKSEAENIGHFVNQMVQYFEPLVQGSIGAASHLNNSKQQEQLLDQVKSVAESALQLIYATKDCGGNPKAINIHPEIDEFANCTKEALQELVGSLETISTQSGIVSGVLDNLTRAMTRLSDHRASLVISDNDNYVDYQTRMVECAKDIAKLAGEMASKASTDTQNLAPLCADLSRKYTQLANDSIGAAAAATNGEVGLRLKDVVQQLGGACVELVQAGGQCLIQKDDVILRDLGDCSRNVSEKVARVLATLQSGSRGTQACINAASTVSGIIGDLETTIMFATAGNLNPENEHESFSDHRENILKTAKALVEDTKTLVAGAASTQEQLAVAAQNSVTTIVQLAEVVKFGASSLGSDNPDSQIMLINAVKDVASALGDLIHATKAASGKPINDPTMSHLKESAKVMVTNVTSLLKTVKAVEDEHTRGTRALESTVEAISQEMRTLYTTDNLKREVTAEDIIRSTKAITKATAKAVSAGISNRQDDIIAVANLARKSISDMLLICKNAAHYLAESPELKDRTLNAGHDCAQQFRELLLAILQGNSADAKHVLPPISRRIAQCVTELVSVAELLKGSDWVDPDDPTVIAENELLGAAASIDAAAKKLASLRPRKTIETQDLDESMNFDEMILEAAKSIAAATSALVKAAGAAQRELIDSGKMSRTPVSSSDDGQWSEGLISAARLVAAATHSLVESANALVKGLGSEDKLISSAKQVASSTAQLLVACKVKAEGDTEATRRLQQAGTAVIRSTDNLVRAAQRAKSVEEERCLVLNKRMVGGMAQEIDARSEVFRIEKELEEARNKLTAIRQAKYKLRSFDTSGEDTDGYSTTQEGETSRSYHADYLQNSYKHMPTQYTDTYSHLESPEKVNYLEHNKMNRNLLKSQIDDLDSVVYANDNSYGQNAYDDQKYNSTHSNISPTHVPAPHCAKVYSEPYYDSNLYSSYNIPNSNSHNASYTRTTAPTFQNAIYSTSHKPTEQGLNPMKHIATSPKSFGSPGQTTKTFDYTTPSSPSYKQKYPGLLEMKPQSSSDGYSSSEYSSNTYKTPQGYKTETYKYETYKSSDQPIYQSIEEKYYTSTPNKNQSTLSDKRFDSIKNGTDTEFQSSFSSNVEYVNEPPVFRDTDSLEQKMLKKSVTQQIVEKKTVSTVRSSKQESSTKTLGFK